MERTRPTVRIKKPRIAVGGEVDDLVLHIESVAGDLVLYIENLAGQKARIFIPRSTDIARLIVTHDAFTEVIAQTEEMA